MFKRREDIEKDFIEYGAPESNPGPGTSLLGTLIQLLSLIVLLGVVTLMGMFGYRYWQKEFAAPSIQTSAPAAAVHPSATASATPQPVRKTGKERLYTQEEMQAIVAMLMEQMQKRLPEKEEQTSSEAHQELPQQASGTLPKDDAESEALAAALENAQIDTIDPEDQKPLTRRLPEERYTKTRAQERAVRHNENRVVVKPSQNSYDDLAKLSQQISGIVSTMQQNRSGSDYTRSIQKEVAVRSDEMRVIIVRRGDTLSKIAQRAYGSAMAYDIILEANPDLIKNPDNIYVGQRLRVPVLKKRKESE